ncbi:Anhydro-N-acetylmuramic acid kinase [Candidatus Terasakiella magnetica]|uniref:Anhydro-N-acetylmuramic acid kinase n=1 Tax=Candidatus Terasakiella magnetica TaxID=1867952 RepID=A0A1C3RLA3_9PROT|nr:anhydro-N-acetylmuramic acid kinase [Candidatus Terasakiella magnetica]SCA58066.1 Anhydro-N-acetylmuramic acid kinase [Candidatus Terasakiella magnetica]
MKLVIGLMSGTSLDGIDVALIRSDGESVDECLGFQSYPYDEEFRTLVQSSFGKKDGFGDLEEQITHRHIQAVERFLQTEGYSRQEIDLIGFHGQTVFHEPENKLTIQLGNGAEMARAVGIDVVNDLRTADVLAGGQGAPLVPVFHEAITKDISRPLAILNLGGVGNVTWIGPDGELLAFDTGPANALVDDWVKQHTGKAFDEKGAIAASGDIHDDAVNTFMTHPYFSKPAPKSLDRDEFKKIAFELIDDLSVEDGAATLTAFTVASVMKAQDAFPYLAENWIVCGGGRLNRSMMSAFNAYLYGQIMSAEHVGWNGDAIEAQAFAYLAARSVKGLPITFSGTTGVKEPMTGGVLHSSSARD